MIGDDVGLMKTQQIPREGVDEFDNSPSESRRLLNLRSALFHASNAIDNYPKHDSVRRTRIPRHDRFNWS